MGRHLSTVVALATVVLLFGAGTIAAAGPQNPQAPGATAPARPDMPGMMNMTKMHEQMMAEMKANEAKLDALVKTMNDARGDARITSLLATVNELARQYKAERAHMAEMHQMMMGGRGMPSAPAAPLHEH